MSVSGDGKKRRLDARPCEEVTREWIVSEALTHETLETWNHSMFVSSK